MKTARKMEPNKSPTLFHLHLPAAVQPSRTIPGFPRFTDAKTLSSASSIACTQITPGVEHRIHTDNFLTHSCSPPSSCPGWHKPDCNSSVPTRTDADRKTPCRTPGRSLTARSSSSPASGGCCSTVTGIPVSRTFLRSAFMIRYNGCTALRTEGKMPCPLSSQPCHLPSALTPTLIFAPFFPAVS